MSIHRILIDRLEGPFEGAAGHVPEQAGRLVVGGEEARHAVRVKRVAPGEPVELLDGRGHVARGRAVEARKSGRGEWELVVELAEVRLVAPPTPRVRVLSGVPKGERLEQMIDGLSQAGAASWAPLRSARGVTDPRPGKLDRLHRVAREAAKQCGRAWVLEIGPAALLSEALEPGVVVADQSGEPYTPSAVEAVTVLIGPEGGWTKDELAAAVAAGARIVRFGPHAMRIETAAVVAAAIVMDAVSRGGGAPGSGAAP